MKLKRALPAKDNIPSREAPFFATATSQSPGVPETLATAYNPGMCLWALPVIEPRMLSSPAVFLFAVFASVNLIFLICENKDLVQSLLDGCDASRVFAVDHIADLFGKLQLFLFDDLLILNNIDRDIVINESEDIKIHEIDGAFDLDNVFSSHFAALCIFDDRNTAVQLVKVKIFIDIHTLARFNMVEHKTFRNTSYVQCTFYHLSVPLFFESGVLTKARNHLWNFVYPSLHEYPTVSG